MTDITIHGELPDTFSIGIAGMNATIDSDFEYRNNS